MSKIFRSDNGDTILYKIGQILTDNLGMGNFPKLVMK